ncbi:phosphoribosyltransferase family protein [Flavobacterium capsici]|uniref:Phosphoribosyltransferase family protein n=1 Tax=Flavobacterium capsici TaxID=3075618 RepID=A0AA96J941_9FLAO|nr:MULTISPECIES: phosphoribosyltransferase family protein [unclassified Flavobacterium]WNM20425.1 phosphoribosyltransferase family protein [Flavobacterium sp. PMR2A8]WNM23131.1 phosphoribosyltransferase family protein [Flavobacterium sp. PMTSA4]
MNPNIILSQEEIEHKIQRIAYQIYETFGEKESIIIAGISQNGFILAKKIHEKLTKIMPNELILCEVFIDKQNPLKSITTSISSDTYENKNVVLIDDVLNTGTTLIYGVRHFLNVPLKKFKTAVLVDRNHKKYPVKADFKGISLSTSTKEHVQVVFEEDKSFAYLE